MKVITVNTNVSRYLMNSHSFTGDNSTYSPKTMCFPNPDLTTHQWLSRNLVPVGKCFVVHQKTQVHSEYFVVVFLSRLCQRRVLLQIEIN